MSLFGISVYLQNIGTRDSQTKVSRDCWWVV